MLRWLTVCLLMCGVLAGADEPGVFKLAAPAGWGGETIPLPPGFAPNMTLKGSEHIRFAPGMMRPDSNSFFSYAFVFELEPKTVLTEAIIREEFLKYYRGLCVAVLNGKRPDVNTAEFTLELRRVETDAERSAANQGARLTTQHTGTLNWVEPFATQKPQQLNLEIWSWAGSDHNYLFACVSPQSRDKAIWKELHKIREDYLKK